MRYAMFFRCGARVLKDQFERTHRCTDLRTLIQGTGFSYYVHQKNYCTTEWGQTMIIFCVSHSGQRHHGHPTLRTTEQTQTAPQVRAKI